MWGGAGPWLLFWHRVRNALCHEGSRGACAQRVVSRGTAPSSSRSKRRARSPAEIFMHSPPPYHGCMRTRFGLGNLAPTSCVAPWCCQNYFGQYKLLYPFTSFLFHCGIFSSCDKVPMMLRRVFGDFDVRGHQGILVPGQGVAIRSGAPRRPGATSFKPCCENFQQIHAENSTDLCQPSGVHSCEVVAVNGKEGKFPLPSHAS